MPKSPNTAHGSLSPTDARTGVIDLSEHRPAEIEDEDDPIIPFDTGIYLIDADPEVIARRLGEKSWEDRARFFNNIISDSLSMLIKMVELFQKSESFGKANSQDLMASTFIGMHQRIQDVLDLWGEEKPTDQHAAAVFRLALSPFHRLEANAFATNVMGLRYHGDILSPWPVLGQFDRLSWTARPGLTHYWRTIETGGCTCGGSDKSVTEG